MPVRKTERKGGVERRLRGSAHLEKTLLKYLQSTNKAFPRAQGNKEQDGGPSGQLDRP